MTEQLGAGEAPVEVVDPRDRRVAHGASGLLAAFNRAGELVAADVHVAQRLGRLAGETDDDVLLAAALAVRAIRAGSVCVDLTALPSGPDSTTGSTLPWPEPEAWVAAVASSPLEGSALHLEDGLLYLDRYWRDEQQVVRDLAERGAADAPTVDEEALAAALAAYFPDEDSADQLAAAATVCRSWTSVLTGGPGTGKTTTVARVLGVLMSLPDPTGQPSRPLRVALAAPTGKAAARMAQAVRGATTVAGFPGPGRSGGPEHDHGAAIRDLQAVTLHRLLGARPDSRTRFRHDRRNRLPHDVVVVDETSMVSLTMMARLLEAVRPGARLVLVGDADQLASVEAGAVLKDLVDGLSQRSARPLTAPSTRVPDQQATTSPVARLTRSRRFGAQIGALAQVIRGGDADSTVAALRAGGVVRWLDPASDEALLEGLRTSALELRAAAEDGDRPRALRLLDAHRLLCAHREGPYGVAWWNRTVERLLAEAAGVERLPEWYAGRPLVVGANDYGLQLFNGDTGVVCAGEPPVAAIDDGVRPGGRALPVSRLPEVSTAHAMTVHRSQGSQFASVSVLLPEEDSRILSRELFYTAVTRAREELTVVATEAAVRAAVGRPARRATGLVGRLEAS